MLSPSPLRWAAASCLMLLATSVFSLFAIENSVFDLISRLTQPMATLIAGIVGLGAIAYQTNRGFKNLIASQDHRADAEKRARADQSEINKQEKLFQANVEMRLMAAALQAELLSLIPRIHRYLQGLNLQKFSWEILIRQGVYQSEIKFFEISTPVYDVMIKQIGALGTSVASDVIQVYSLSQTLKSVPSTGEQEIKFLKQLIESIYETHSEWVDEILHVAARLSYLQGSGTDPGLLQEFRRKRDDQKKLIKK